jgi:hypothetical protein
MVIFTLTKVTSMKSLSLLLMFCLFHLLSVAQVKGDSKIIDITSKITKAKTKNGKQLIDTNSKIRLFAEFKNGKIVKLSALNSSVSEVPVAITKAKGTVKCRACVEDEFGRDVCWYIDCKDLPRPPNTN